MNKLLTITMILMLGVGCRAKRPTIEMPTLQNVFEKVLADAEYRYDMVVKGGGSDVQICVQASLAKAAAIQSKNSIKFKEWKTVEHYRCNI